MRTAGQPLILQSPCKASVLQGLISWNSCLILLTGYVHPEIQLCLSICFHSIVQTHIGPAVVKSGNIILVQSRCVLHNTSELMCQKFCILSNWVCVSIYLYSSCLGKVTLPNFFIRRMVRHFQLSSQDILYKWIWIFYDIIVILQAYQLY